MENTKKSGRYPWNEDNPIRNEEGYMDLTPHDAIENIDREEREHARVAKLIHTVQYICSIGGYWIDERIVLRNKRTGKVWK